jgi:arsenical pump membrane protein
MPWEAISDMRTFKTSWLVLLMLLAGFFGLVPLGGPVNQVAAVAAFIL